MRRSLPWFALSSAGLAGYVLDRHCQELKYSNSVPP
jgi:hypothetical protein